MNDIKLSFCIPVMNRLTDLQATLRKNLDDNIDDQAFVEFIVVCFDKDDTTAQWVHATFYKEITTGYLRFYRSDKLQNWHFGRAKNSFRGLTRGKIYASLDGDNFTGSRGGRHIIDVFESNAYNCVFHQFQGDWGDGTCGRVSMSMRDYEESGYDESFLPRQWDELDAILTILVRCPERRYVCYRGKSILKKSQPFARFLNENGLNVPVIEVDGKLDPLARETLGVAVGQNKSTYVQDDARLKYSSIFNHLTSFYKNTSIEVLRTQYVGELVQTQRKMIEEIDASILLNWFLTPERTQLPRLTRNDIALAACIRNEESLEEWLDYYRDLGVSHFLLIDDGSFDAISKRIKSQDVWVWKPKCGVFRYSKAFWMELLLRTYVCGNWALTVDSDEYLELPSIPTDEGEGIEKHLHPLRQLIDFASQSGIQYFAGFLLDLAPGPEALPKLNAGQELARVDYKRYQFRPNSVSVPYQSHNTVKWSYGKYSAWAYRVDIRFRLNRALDSLRKFPVFEMHPDIHLNQGFHDLIIRGEKRSSEEMGRSDLLIVRHYKLLATQRDALSKDLRPVTAYHPETSINLLRLRTNIHFALRGAALSPFTFAFINHALTPVPACTQISLRICAPESREPREFGKALTRSGDILVRIVDSDARFSNCIVEARTLDDAVAWIKAATPFRFIKSVSSNHAVLTVEHENMSEQLPPA